MLTCSSLGQYIYADVHEMSACTYPAYLANRKTSAYYIPFRALTVEGRPNMLTAGKTISQTFLANAATRLHPVEWTTGLAAGAAAQLMVDRSWDTTSVLRNISELQSSLSAISPLVWTVPQK